MSEPLFVHRSVTDWLRHGRNGIYIIKPAEGAIALRNETLGVERKQDARDLSALLTLRSPPVIVARAEIAA